jgi:hypothetical protein
MATQRLNLICDQSTFANFLQWASAVSAWFAACGWMQSNDTGQEMWTNLSISAVAMSGTTMTCTYGSLTGQPLAVGRALTITGWTAGNTGNNGTFVITALGSGTFSAVNASGANVGSGGTGVVTAATSVPGSGAFVYEIWQPNDGLTNFFLKMEYGNYTSTTNCPTVRMTISTATNGAGVSSGTIMGPWVSNFYSYSAPSTTVSYDSVFSGSPGRIAVLLWRTGGNNSTQVFAVERSLNSSGAYTGAHVTLMAAGCVGAVGAYMPYSQQTLVFGVGVAPAPSSASTYSRGGLCCRSFYPGGNATALFNGAIPFDTTAPAIGYFDYPLTSLGIIQASAGIEGSTFTATLYGTTRTYLQTQAGSMGFCVGPGSSNTSQFLCMRYD